MNIRSDFSSVEVILNRLLQYASAFDRYNKQDWSHLKHNEDFEKVYDLDWNFREPLEDIYANGKDLAVFMSSKLQEFNDPSINPTLKKFVDSFYGGWLYQIDILKSESQKAKDLCKRLSSVPWAIPKMITLYDQQIELLLAIKHSIDSLKETDLYKWEAGQAQQTFPVPEYQKILECIHSIGMMFERLPSTYVGKDEESLRDHILVSLQGLVAGSATGESFNKRGKTDILVRNGDTNEFVGECKFWRGKSVYLDTINQLLSYLSWRDTKTAIIIFVPNHDFSAVIKKVAEYTKEHPSYLRDGPRINDTWQHFDFRMNDDQSKIVNIAVMLYHIPPNC